MLCYFLRDGQIAGVEMLPLGLSDEDAITRAHTLSSKRKGRSMALRFGIAPDWSGFPLPPRRLRQACGAAQRQGRPYGLAAARRIITSL
jgi:hypothetical protein